MLENSDDSWAVETNTDTTHVAGPVHVAGHVILTTRRGIMIPFLDKK